MANTSPAPITEGRTITWARRYDLLVAVLSLGQAPTFRARTANLAHLSPGEAVLDVGCGTGDLARAAYKRVGPTGLTAGIDASPQMIAHARQKATRAGMTIDFRVEPVEALSFADRTFDVVVSSLVFHHLPDALKERGLAEIRRVLKPGGRLLIVDFLRPRHGLSIHSHVHAHAGPQNLPALLHKAGFLEVDWKRGPFPLVGSVYGRTPGSKA